MIQRAVKHNLPGIHQIDICEVYRVTQNTIITETEAQR